MADGLILCVDGGGTLSRGRLMAPSGKVLGEAKAGPCNAFTDLTGAARSVADLWALLAQPAGVDVHEAHRHTLAIGAAGIVEPGVREAFLKAVPPFGKLIAMSDGYAAMVGAGGGMPCGLLIVGTGAVAHRLREDGGSIQRDGWGWVCGDRGSGAWIGRAAVQIMLEAEDGVGKRGPLSQAVSEALGGKQAAYLAWLARATPQRLAGLAPQVAALAAAGDAEASDLLNRAATHAAATVVGLQMPAAHPIFIAGGLAEVLQRRIEAELGRPLRMPENDAMHGAFLVATGRAPQESRP